MNRNHMIFIAALGVTLVYFAYPSPSRTVVSYRTVLEESIEQKEIPPAGKSQLHKTVITGEETAIPVPSPEATADSSEFTEECLEQTGHTVVADSLFPIDGEASRANEYAQFSEQDLLQLAEGGDSTAQIIYSMEYASPAEADNWFKRASIETGYSDIAGLAVIRYLEEAALLQAQLANTLPNPEDKSNSAQSPIKPEDLAGKYLLTAAKWFEYAKQRNDPVVITYYGHHFAQLRQGPHIWKQVEQEAGNLLSEIDKERQVRSLPVLESVDC